MKKSRLSYFTIEHQRARNLPKEKEIKVFESHARLKLTEVRLDLEFS